jgi:hypothetical protein
MLESVMVGCAVTLKGANGRTGAIDRIRVFTGVIHAIVGLLVLILLEDQQSVGTDIPEAGGR